MRSGIALGSNIGDRLGHLQEGFRRILRLNDPAGPVRRSAIYETSPVDSPPDASAYLNAVVEIEFAGPAITLLDALSQIERDMGRPSKRPRNAPRIIDLDVLYTGNLILNNPEIIIPHPRLVQRRFILTPLAEIAPDLILPGQSKSVQELLNQLEDQSSVQRIAERLG
jgi:2-amino-4-hydroxy-6-hydroxymethyldihydropteridine diphosphokinase